MPDVWFAIPGDPNTLTGGYIYARRLMQALPAVGWMPRPLPWPGSFPYPSRDDLGAVRASLEGVPAGGTVLIDGLAFGALPAVLLDGLNLRIVALVHHPLARESGLAEQTARRFAESEREALTRARRIITTSAMTARTLTQDFGVPGTRITVALPGTDPAPRARGSQTPLILTVGTLTPRKGHDVLIAALSEVSDLAWTSRIIGSKDRDPATTSSLRHLISRCGLEGRIDLAGEMEADALREVFHQATIFALASRYEGYGMVFAEALAHGLPVVACAAGAVPDTVPADAGLLVPPDHPGAFSAALRRVLTDHTLRLRLADAARRHGLALPQWRDTAAAVAVALSSAQGAAA